MQHEKRLVVRNDWAGWLPAVCLGNFYLNGYIMYPYCMYINTRMYSICMYVCNNFRMAIFGPLLAEYIVHMHKSLTAVAWCWVL